MNFLSNEIQRLISRAEDLEECNLREGYERFEDWKSDINELFTSLHRDFNETVRTPLDVGDGIRFLKDIFHVE